MAMKVQINAIVLAAGQSKRFGTNKMTQLVDDKCLLEYTLDKLRKMDFSQIVVVASTQTWYSIKNKNKLCWAINESPELGMSYSIKQGIGISERCEGYFFIVGDQPMVRKQTIEAMIEAFRGESQWIYCAAHNGIQGNPTIFPSHYKQEFLSLEGEVGGRQIIRRHAECVKTYDVAYEEELFDIDLPQDYEEFIRRRTHATFKG